MGKAGALDPTSQVVTVNVNGGSDREVKYDSMIIAMGASDRNSMPFKNLNTPEETKVAVTKLQQDIKAAKTLSSQVLDTPDARSLAKWARSTRSRDKRRSFSLQMTTSSCIRQP